MKKYKFVTPLEAVRLGVAYENRNQSRFNRDLFKSLTAPQQKHTLKKGDCVKIKNYSKELNGKLGFVVHIDGGYILVRPRWSKHEVDLLDCEVEKA